MLQKAALGCIRFYRVFLSPHLPPSCRFSPTCSHYTYQAIERFGVWRGVWLGVRRLCRCQPFHRRGIDLVPEFWGQKVNFVPDGETPDGLAEQNDKELHKRPL